MPALPDERMQPSVDSFVANLRFANGAHGIVHTSWCTKRQVPGFGIEVHGEAGAVQAGMDWNHVRVTQGSETVEEPIADEHWGQTDPTLDYVPRFLQRFERESIGTRGFIDAMVDDVSASPSFDDGLRAQEILDAIFRRE